MIPPRAEGNDGRWPAELGSYLTIGIQLALPAVLLFLIGLWLDEKYGTTPWLQLAGLTIGITGGFIKFVRTALSLGKKADGAAKQGRGRES